MMLEHSPGLDPIPENKRAEARVSLDNNQDLSEILNSTSAEEVREKLFKSYDINPAHPFTQFDGALLAEAVGRWNKSRTERQSE